MFTLIENIQPRNTAVIKVIGVGGGGCNTLDYMVDVPIEGVDLIAANTDAQTLTKSALQQIPEGICLQLGESVTGGLGAGCNPEIGKAAAIEDREKIQETLAGADMVFIAAGMGGGTGTGATPVIAEIARANSSLTIAVVTKPFALEGQKRMDAALAGIQELSRHVDSLITIPNEKLLSVLGDVLMQDACIQVDKILHNAVQGIAELITRRGRFNNLDFADVKTVMRETGAAMIGVGFANGENRAYEAAQAAVSNPLLDDIDLSNVQGLLVNITAGNDFRLKEYQEIAECMHGLAARDANMVIGQVVDDKVEDEVRVTLVATGLDNAMMPGALINEKVSILTLPTVDAAVGQISSDNRQSASVAREDVANSKSQTDNSEYQDYLDIPTFLRQQVD